MKDHLGALRRTYASYRGAPAATRAFVAARLAIAPLRPLEEELRGVTGRLLSLGSGLGVVERYLAERHPGIEVEGVDLDPGRVELVRATAQRSPRVTLRLGDLTALDEPPVYDAVLACDVLHHVDGDTHKAVAASVADSLVPGGVALVKDLDVLPRWKFEWNRVHDRIVAGPDPICCRPPGAVADVLAEAGLTVERVERIDHRASPYAHYLVRARKPDRPSPPIPARQETNDPRSMPRRASS